MASAEPGQGLNGPRRTKPPATAPVQVPSVSPQALSRIAIVWLVPSVIAAMRTPLLRKNRPLPEPSLLSPKATSAASLPVQAA